jgi:O-antigen/teichoic acid export membrane protein
MGPKIVRAQEWVGRAWDQVSSPLYRNAFYIMAASVVGAALGGIFQFSLARLYPVATNAADLGWAVVLFQDVSFIATLALFGLSVGIVRFLPETEDKVALVNTALTVVGFAVLVLTVIFLGSLAFILPDLNFVLSNPIYPIVIVVTGLAIGFAPILDQAGIGMRQASPLFWRTVIYSALKIAFVIAFAFIEATKGRLGIFLALSVPFGIGAAVEALVLLPRVLPGYRPRPSLRMEILRPSLRFNLGNYAASVIGAGGSLLLPSIILVVIGGSAGAAQVGFYYFAVSLSGLLGIIPNATFTSFYGEASQRNAQRHADEQRAIALSLVLLAPAIAVLWFFGLPVLQLLIQGYAVGATGPFHVLVLSSIPAFLNTILATRVRIRKRSLPLIVGSILGTVVTIALGVVLLRSSGLDGLAAAVVLGQAVQTPYYYLVARKSFREEDVPPMPPVEM